eukprot:2366194-Prymnesium_polylepis.1
MPAVHAPTRRRGTRRASPRPPGPPRPPPPPRPPRAAGPPPPDTPASAPRRAQTPKTRRGSARGALRSNARRGRRGSRA